MRPALTALASLGGALASCGLVACGGREAPLPPKPSVISITMRDYRFERDQSQRIAAGRVVFRVRNAGRVRHQLILIRIPDNLAGSLAEQLRSRRRRAVIPLAILSGRRPLETGAFASDLPPGRYGIVCFLKDAKDKSHALKGMNAELRLR